MRIACYLWLLCSTQASFAFALLEGSNKARLDVTPQSPTVVMYWNGKYPKMKKTSEITRGTSIDPDDHSAVMFEALTRAIALWNDVPGAYLNIEISTNTSAVIDSSDGVHVIGVDSSSNHSIIAFAQPKTEQGVIIDCDITIGDNTIDAKVLTYALAHELGHCIGLGHDHSNYKALMGYSRSNHNPRLGADDIAGLIYLYPDPAYDSKELNVLNCASVPGGVGPSQLLLFYALLFLPLGYAVLRRWCSGPDLNWHEVTLARF